MSEHTATECLLFAGLLERPMVASVRRIVVHFPQGFPYLHPFSRLARALGDAPA